MNALKNFIAREEGQDLVEYALLAALLSIVSIAALKTLGPKIAKTWGRTLGCRGRADLRGHGDGEDRG